MGRRFEGVLVVAEDYSDLDKTFDKKAIKNQVELKLRLAGIKPVLGATQDSIVIGMPPIIAGDKVTGYALSIKATRKMSFKYNGEEYIAFGACTKSYGGFTPINYRPRLDELMDFILLQYKKANPKPKEKKSLIEP